MAAATAVSAGRVLGANGRIVRRKDAVANEEEGYYSAMACFMANQAFRTRSRVTWDPEWDLPA